MNLFFLDHLSKRLCTVALTVVFTATTQVWAQPAAEWRPPEIQGQTLSQFGQHFQDTVHREIMASAVCVSVSSILEPPTSDASLTTLRVAQKYETQRLQDFWVQCDYFKYFLDIVSFQMPEETFRHYVLHSEIEGSPHLLSEADRQIVDPAYRWIVDNTPEARPVGLPAPVFGHAIYLRKPITCYIAPFLWNPFQSPNRLDVVHFESNRENACYGRYCLYIYPS